MRKIGPFFIPLLFVFPVAIACAHSETTPVQGPDGQPGWYAISCKKNQANCLEAAGDACPTGYDIARQDGRSGTVVSGSVSPWGGGFAAHPTYNGDMLIKCHAEGVAVMQAQPAGP